MKKAIKTTLQTVNKSMDAGQLDKDATAKADSLMLAYANKFPNDTMSPEFMFKTAQLYKMQRNFSEANKLLDKLITDYPDSKAAPYGLFLNGFMYENDEFLLDKAKEHYELFLKKYPNHQLAPSVKTSLQYLGKSPDEIINNRQADSTKAPG